MKSTSLRVIDTNVLLVANGQHENTSDECMIACIEALEKLRESGGIVLDDGYQIINEYQRNTSPNSGQRFGDAFLKWLLQNVQNRKYVELVTILPHPERGYESFPDDGDLIDFDTQDRKFIAVSVVHGHRPKICQGTDSKWLIWSEKLARHGINVEFLCSADVQRFFNRKINNQ